MSERIEELEQALATEREQRKAAEAESETRRIIAATERSRADSFNGELRELWRIIEDAPGPNSWTEFRPDKYVMAIRLMSGYRAEVERLQGELAAIREAGGPEKPLSEGVGLKDATVRTILGSHSPAAAKLLKKIETLDKR